MENFINWNTLDFKKSTGKEKVRCPSCDEQRTDKKDKSLLVNHNDGYGKCFYCEALTFKNEDKLDYSKKQYIIPEQNWKNYTNISDRLIKWIETTRKISQSTLINLGITEEKYYQPKIGKEVNNIVFNYFEGEKLINKKYRSADKCFTQTSGTKQIFYNINSIIGQKECYIVEGEFDVLALYDFGIKNVISVPNGANDNDEYWKNSEIYLKDIEKFIIAVDNDEKGNILKEKIAQRLGRYKCQYIEWKYKDANGDKIEDCLNESLKNRKNFPVSGTYSVLDLKDDILNIYDNGLPETIYPKHRCFGDFKNKFSVMRGHLVVGTGIPSHGKSNFTEWLVLNLMKDYNMKSSFFSPEHSPMELHQTTFIQKAVGKNFWKEMDGIERINKEDIERYIQWANQKLYITMPEKGDAPTWEWILEKFKEQVYSFGIDIFVIDAFNKLRLPKGEKIDAINNVLTELTMFAQMNNVVVFLIAHPTKMKKNEKGIYECPDLYSVSGSADFRNQTHDGYAIYRYFDNEETDLKGYTSFLNLKTKLSFQGEIGATIDFDYHIPTGRYYLRGMNAPTFDMTKDIEEIEEPIIELKDIEKNIDFLKDGVASEDFFLNL